MSAGVFGAMLGAAVTSTYEGKDQNDGKDNEDQKERT